MAYFKPKNAVYNGQVPRRQEQPFYVSWFQQQGELKRGGTAPHESRKAMEQQRTPQQPPNIFKLQEPTQQPVQRPQPQRFKNSPYLAPQQPRSIKHNLQEISKIYTAGGASKAFQQKRRSQELAGGKVDPKLYQLRSYQATQQGMFQRTYTSSNQRGQKIPFDDKRPNSQQQSGIRQIYRQHDYEDGGVNNVYQQYEDLESDAVDLRDQRLAEDNLSDMVHSDDEEPVQRTNGNVDALSNESQGAESRRNSLSPKGEQLANRSAFQQRDEEVQVVESLRKTTANMHRPMTSEGGRRKRNMQLGEMGDRAQYQTEKTLDEKSKTTQNLSVQKEETEELEFDGNLQIGTNRGECQMIQDFDDELDMYPPESPDEKEEPPRSGYRRKATGDNPIQVTDDYATQRPPSRHKFPPKAVCLEVPNTAQMQDIPIKNMYANVGDENSFEDMLKVNNKVNMSNFMRKETQADESEKRPTFQSDQGERPAIIPKGSHRNHPQSANTKYKPGFNMSFSPMGPQIQPPHSSKAVQSNTENFEIVIKHNTSTNFQKQGNQGPVKVPFQTSLGQDFLRLFANQHFTN